MSDCEETDLFWEPWTWTPGKEKRKKNLKKNKKHKNNMKKDESAQKKKKKSKFKAAMEERKEKKKEKKKKKTRLALEQHDSFTFTQGGGGAHAAVTPETSTPHSCDKPEKRKNKKKKVAFDLSPRYICVKRPKFAPLTPKESILVENEAAGHSESCSQVTATAHIQGQTHPNESQCTSEDINSQDLFITQKTFRASPPEPSSGEASDRAVTKSPQMFTSTREDASMVWMTEHRKGSYKDSHFHQHHGEANSQTVQVLLTEEEEEEQEQVKKANQYPKKDKTAFQTQMELNASEEKKVHKAPRVVNAYLDEPIDVKPSQDASKPKKRSRPSSQQSPSPSPVAVTSTSTQTENFFTTELSSYLSFCQKNRVIDVFEDLKPLDLSLPKRARKDLGTSVKMPSLPGEIRGDDHIVNPSCSSDVKHVEGKKEASGVWSASTHGRGERSRSPQSESETKSADTTTSSEDEPPCRTGKLDLTQMRAVQMRLNESFFFKTKGDGQSPRPESPLMKLVQGRQVKSRRNRN